MNSKERMQIIGRGGIPDVPGKMFLFGHSPQSDVWVVRESDTGFLMPEDAGNRLVLARVDNPFGLGMRRNADFRNMIKDDGVAARNFIDELSEEVEKTIESTLLAGQADGIAYMIYGAEPQLCTPMAYGGICLEADRRLLERIGKQHFIALMVVAGEGSYIDFLSDLPGNLFCWDAASTGVDVHSVRRLRHGALGCQLPEAEVLVAKEPGEMGPWVGLYKFWEEHGW